MKIYKLSINTQKEYHIGNNSEQFERLTFDFDDPKNPLNNVLWTTEIQFDYDFYQKLIFSKKNEDKRQHNYLAIANKLIT